MDFTPDDDDGADVDLPGDDPQDEEVLESFEVEDEEPADEVP